VYYLNAINSNAKLIERLRHAAPKVGFSAENLQFIEDMLIETASVQQAEIYSEHSREHDGARVSMSATNLNWALMKTLTLSTNRDHAAHVRGQSVLHERTIPGEDHPLMSGSSSG